MIKILLTVAVLGTVGSFAGLAMAEGKQGEAVGNEESSRCAHRKVMPPDPRDNCGASASQTSGAGAGIGPGNAVRQGIGTGQGIGPGNGGGQAFGRR
jgi:hypothetical protein